MMKSKQTRQAERGGKGKETDQLLLADTCRRHSLTPDSDRRPSNRQLRLLCQT